MATRRVPVGVFLDEGLCVLTICVGGAGSRATLAKHDFERVDITGMIRHTPNGQDVDALPLTQLPTITMPTVCIATAQQRRWACRWYAPHGMCSYLPESVWTRHSMRSALTRTLPHSSSAMWFRELHAAFHSAQFIHRCDGITDVARLCASETVELEAAGAGRRPPDDSLAPRMLAIWVVVYEHNPAGSLVRAILDGVAHLAQSSAPCEAKPRRLANWVRFTVVGVKCAEALQRRILYTDAARMDTRWGVIVRWAAGGQTHAAQMCVATTPSSAAAFAAELQRSVAHLCWLHGAPCPSQIHTPIGGMPREYEFALLQCAIDTEFDSLATSVPSAELAAPVASAASPPLEYTHVPVRIFPRHGDSAGVASARAFHGVLLGVSRESSTLRAVLVESQQRLDGLLAPRNERERALALHVCAVHVNEVFLRDAVTLYGPVGTPGLPIRPWPNSPGGTWMWSECTALRPVDARLLADFVVHPCTRTSVLPAETVLHASSKAHMVAVHDLFAAVQEKRFFGANNAACTTPMPTWSASMTPPLRKIGHTESDFLSVALQLDLRSERTTMADALRALGKTPGVGASLSRTLLGVVATIGGHASLAKGFAHCDDRIRSASRREATLVKRLKAQKHALARLVAAYSTAGVEATRTARMSTRS